jgi:hypothetical protein
MKHSGTAKEAKQAKECSAQLGGKRSKPLLTLHKTRGPLVRTLQAYCRNDARDLTTNRDAGGLGPFARNPRGLRSEGRDHSVTTAAYAHVRACARAPHGICGPTPTRAAP